MTAYRRVTLARPYVHTAVSIRALDYCVGEQSDRATVLHVRGRCNGEVVFAGCLVLCEGRDEPVHDLKTYGRACDRDVLAAAVEACLARRTTVIRREMERMCGPGRRLGDRR